jgi:hypothetical protein
MADLDTIKREASLHDVFTRNKFNLKDITAKSYSWYTQQSLLLGKQGFTSKRVLSSPAGIQKSKVVPGKLYMYRYDAKYKDTLPYWDMFQWCFPLKSLKVVSWELTCTTFQYLLE